MAPSSSGTDTQAMAPSSPNPPVAFSNIGAGLRAAQSNDTTNDELPVATRISSHNNSAMSTPMAAFMSSESAKEKDTTFMLQNTELPNWVNDGGTGTFWSSVLNLLMAGLGAGVLGLPIAFQEAGLGLGIGLCVVFGCLIAYSLHIIGRAQQLTNCRTYQATVLRLIGSRAEKVIIILQLMSLTAACVGFLDIIPAQVAPVIHEWSGGTVVVSRSVIIFVVAAFLLPMLFIRNVQKLWPLASFAMIALCFTLSMMVGRSSALMADSTHHLETCIGEPTPEIGSQVSWARRSAAILEAVPIICLAFNAHTTYPLVFAELQAPRSVERIDKAAGFFIFGSFVLLVLCGTFGYIYAVMLPYKPPSQPPTSWGTVPGDALRMFPPTADVKLARLCIVISVAGSFVTKHFAVRVCLQDLLVKHQQGGLFTRAQRTFETFAYLAFTVGASLVLKHLALVLHLSGSIAVIPLMFIFPGWLQVKMDGKASNRAVFSFRGRYNGYLMMGLGLCLSITSLSSTFALLNYHPNTSRGK